MYNAIGGQVVRDDGFIAVSHRNTNGTSMKIGGTSYVWTPLHNVSMAWVSPEHLDIVLKEMARICCGKTSKKFYLASITNVNLWTTGDRNGN